MTLTDTQTVLLAKLLAKDAKSIKLAAGHHSVDGFTFTCDGGSISVGDDETYTPTTSIPLLATMVVALHRAGFQREGIASLIIDAATDAVNAGGKVGDELETTIAYVQQEVADLKARLSAELPDKVRAGKVRVKAR
jgi:hypothetical protein